MNFEHISAALNPAVKQDRQPALDGLHDFRYRVNCDERTAHLPDAGPRDEGFLVALLSGIANCAVKQNNKRDDYRLYSIIRTCDCSRCATGYRSCQHSIQITLLCTCDAVS